MSRIVPILTVVAALVALWYAAVAPMNIHGAVEQAARSGEAVTPETPAERRDMGGIRLLLKNPGAVPMAYAQERPRLPAPPPVIFRASGFSAKLPTLSRQVPAPTEVPAGTSPRR